MSEEKFYRCIPELNKECKKNNCYINGGECETTIYKKYTLKGLLEEIERLNNIINEIKKGLDKFYKEHSRLLWTEEDYIEFINCIDREIKGVDKDGNE